MNADGIILLTNQGGIRETIEKCKVPVVILDREVQADNQVACIRSDHYKGGMLAAEHLIRCGCRRIVNMRGDQALSSARDRFEGYLDVCRKYEMVPRYVDCRYSFREGLKKSEEILKLYPDVDGIIAGNDMVAVSVYKTLSKKGYRVPEDIQLIGYDNINLSELVTPELTTVAQPISRMGETSAKVLIDYVENKKISDNYHFDVELIQRDTTIMKQGGERK